MNLASRDGPGNAAAKEAPYECGIVPSREPPDRFPVTFYVVAMLFIMFDIEIIFLYPYAVQRGALGAFGFWAIVSADRKPNRRENMRTGPSDGSRKARMRARAAASPRN